MTRLRYLCSVVCVIMSALFVLTLFSSCTLGSSDPNKDAVISTTAPIPADNEKAFSYDKKYYAEKAFVKDNPGNFSLVIYQTDTDEKLVELMPSFRIDKITWDDKQYRITVSSADGKSQTYYYAENKWLKSDLL